MSTCNYLHSHICINYDKCILKIIHPMNWHWNKYSGKTHFITCNLLSYIVTSMIITHLPFLMCKREIITTVYSYTNILLPIVFQSHLPFSPIWILYTEYTSVWNTTDAVILCAAVALPTSSAILVSTLANSSVIKILHVYSRFFVVDKYYSRFWAWPNYVIHSCTSALLGSSLRRLYLVEHAQWAWWRSMTSMVVGVVL